MQENDENEISVMHAMLDDAFHVILENDEVLNELEKQKHSPQTQYFELMTVLSRTYKIDGVVVSCITPAIWAFLYSIDSPYTKDEPINEIDTDIFLYILHHGIKEIDADLIEKAFGFCEAHNINPSTAEADIKMLIYLSFRPLEMLSYAGQHSEKQRFDLDWVTHLVSVVAPLTNRTSEEIIYDTSLCECHYYMIQQARQYDYKGEIRRRNSDEINAAIFERTMELGRQYWEEHYAIDDPPKSKD